MKSSPFLSRSQRVYGWFTAVADLLQPLLLLAMRLYIGWNFFVTGKGKLGGLEKVAGYFQELGVPLPHINAALVGMTECVGGLLLMLGLASRLVSVPLTIAMVVAYLTAEREALNAIFSDPDKFLDSAPLPFLLTALVVLAFGPGPFSLDWLLARWLRRGAPGAIPPGPPIPLIALAALLVPLSAHAEKKPAIEWQPWSDRIFEKAKAGQKLVLLDLGAVWCHWCHVMDEITYADPEVARLLREKFIAVRVDQDARPDLANRYEDYGWPATIIFKWDGSELAKRRGYIPPKPMASMLQAFIDDPTPGPSVEAEPAIVAASDAAVTKEQRAAARAVFLDAYDAKRGGWGDVHKYLNWDALEYCLTDADPKLNAMARQTLTAGLKLVDPAWGGVYQYSTDGDWDHPHFEKIMPFQAENLRVFALAASLRREAEWLEPARKIRGYLRDFLTSPDGAFYVSQDADLVQGEHSGEYFALDDAARRKRGVPRVDKHLYARENGLAITGLAALYAATGDAAVLADARRAADWVLAHRAREGGGFRHDEKDTGGPYLADTLAMTRAFLALYTVTAERAWLARAEQAAAFIDATFRGAPGFLTAVPAGPLPPKPQVDENIALARLANLLHHHTGKAAWRAMAEHAMRFLASPVVVDQQGFATSGILLADRELTTEPAHLTVVGAKDDAAAQALFAAVLRSAPGYARIEWLDQREGPLPRAEVEFPALPRAAAFICANGACSVPLRTPEQVAERLARKR